MAKEHVRAIFEAHLKTTGGDVQKANQGFSAQVQNLIENEEVTLEHIGLGDLFETMVDRDRSFDRTTPPQVVAEAMMAAGMPTLTGQLLHPVFMKAYSYQLDDVLPLVQQVSSKRSEEKIPGITAHDNMEMVPEGEPYEESGGLEKYATVKNYKFGRKKSLTLEAVLFDQTNLILGWAKKVGNKAGVHLHAMIIQKVCDFACTATGEDAEKSLKREGTARAMYANDHSAWDINSNDNLGGAALGHSGLVAALTLLGGLKDETGDYVNCMPRFLIVPVALQVAAQELVGSDMQYDTANRAINIFKNKFVIKASPYLDAESATNWFVGDPSLQTRLQWVWKPRTETLGKTSQVAFDNDVVSQFKTSYMAGVGSEDYKCVVKGNA